MVEKNFLLFQTIFDQSPISTQVFSVDGETIMVNKAWEALWQAKFSDVKSYNILKDKQLVKTGSMPYIKRGFKGEVVDIPAIRYEPAKTINLPGIAPYRWLYATMYPIKDEEGKILYIVLQHQDITERKKAEEIQFRLAAIVEYSDDAIISKNLDSIITSWNHGAENMLGYKADEVVGRHISFIVPPRLRKEEQEIMRKIKKGEQTEHFETWRIKKDGTVIPVSLSISPVKDDRGTIIGASKIMRDITKEKQSQQDLQESEERLRLALDAGRIGVWDWDIVNDKLTWTENVYHIHGVAPDSFAVTLNSFRNLIHSDDKKRVKEQ
ncbi:MAG TPA: PAS domain S-box protein, partial [Flavobacterium sp.]|nr:PAS domain S-box protein [Flavobacterium sp.]